ncbi:unnamed protein product [Schistosoma mattheei]|uniref:Uncharacterized protein n=1 Tax=Schistosoma mattheei TaxID=31246 RepID=A0A183PIH1_9TREM|nr:unnamed protein product [Schistosoma mattheei]
MFPPNFLLHATYFLRLLAIISSKATSPGVFSGVIVCAILSSRRTMDSKRSQNSTLLRTPNTDDVLLLLPSHNKFTFEASIPSSW